MPFRTGSLACPTIFSTWAKVSLGFVCTTRNIYDASKAFHVGAGAARVRPQSRRAKDRTVQLKVIKVRANKSRKVSTPTELPPFWCTVLEYSQKIDTSFIFLYLSLLQYFKSVLVELTKTATV
jgi:hypothetical protein